MKRILFFLAFVALSCGAKAQDMTFMLEEFEPATIYLNNGTFAKAMMNYEYTSGKILYMEDGEMMEIADATKITSIEFKDGHEFIQYGNNVFFEKVTRENGEVFVHWKVRVAQVGNKGAYGTTTQARVGSLKSTTQIGIVNIGEKLVKTGEVYSQRNDNTYIFVVKEKQHKVKNLKNVYKQFPEQAEAIKKYVDDNKLSMDIADEALKIIDFIFSIV